MSWRGRRSKYNARRTVYNGETYDSQMEANRAATLELERRAGRILGWERGSSVVVFPGPTRARTIRFKPDFIVYHLDGSTHAEDVKGLVRLKPRMGVRGLRRGQLVLPKDVRIRIILWEALFPDIPVLVVDQHGVVMWRLGETDGKEED